MHHTDFKQIVITASPILAIKRLFLVLKRIKKDNIDYAGVPITILIIISQFGFLLIIFC